MKHPSLKEALKFWILLGFISFGGPTGQIAIMFNELVEKKKWISESRFLHALNFCMLLPGPEATQFAIYVGWLLHGTWGGLFAGIFFILPSIFILWILSYFYILFESLPFVAAIFYGLKPAVVAIVAAASINIGKKTLKNKILSSIAILSFVFIYFLEVPFPLIILLAAITGFIGGYFREDLFNVFSVSKSNNSSVIHDTFISPHYLKPSLKKSILVSLFFLILWATPLLMIGFFKGWHSVLLQIGLFFSKVAMVTFGGAYSVLSYVAKQSVEYYQWLAPNQMIDGLGLAETTPGPLIMVVQFVGFLGGWNHPEGLSPLTSATLGAFITTWVTFVPCFYWIFLGAPYIENLRDNKKLISTLTGVTAAIVGVIFNLAVWFGWHALVDTFSILISIVSFIALWRYDIGIIPVIFASGLAGLLYHLIYQAIS